jgi:hypothetical protein
MSERIYVDFNIMACDLGCDFERVIVPQAEKLSGLQPGQRVGVYDETLEVEAVLEYDEEHAVWWARPIWATSRDLPYP